MSDIQSILNYLEASIVSARHRRDIAPTYNMSVAWTSRIQTFEEVTEFVQLLRDAIEGKP